MLTDFVYLDSTDEFSIRNMLISLVVFWIPKGHCEARQGYALS